MISKFMSTDNKHVKVEISPKTFIAFYMYFSSPILQKFANSYFNSYLLMDDEFVD
jgi:hypothetical protein